ncbi:class I tRNA ligase family protein [Candidatus Gracilibacteria bacterium]|nr:class I tRNA ligase family protein [Candidatus Gracilibacteria bacterium]
MKVENARKAMIKSLIESRNIPKKMLRLMKNWIKKIAEYFGFRQEEVEGWSQYDIDWNYEHNVTICERSKTVVEPLISEEFFLSYFEPTSREGKTLQELALEGISETKYFSENFRDMGENFVENIHDWVISRDLVWGHSMPVWYNLDTNLEKNFFSASEIGGNEDKFRVQPVKPKDGNWVQETKILDTWFSSCLWPLSTLNYLEAIKDVEWEDIPKKLTRGQVMIFSNTTLLMRG